MSRRTNTAVWMEKQGRWQINVQKDGKRRSFYSSKPGRTGQREANKKADDWLDQGIVSRKKTVNDLWPEYLAKKQSTTSIDNWRPIDSRYRTWIAPKIGKRRLEALTDQDLQDVLDDACAAGKSKKTIENLLGDLTGLVKFARKSGYTSYIPDEVSVPGSARLRGKVILQPDGLTILMNSDETVFKRKVVKDEYIHFYRLAVLTGMRPGELLGLEWSDLDGNVIHLHQSQNIRGVMTKGKNDNALRTVVLSGRAMQELNAQRALSGQMKRIFPVHKTEHFRRRWKIYCAHNGIRYCTLYELRHTFVSIASIAHELPEGQLKSIVGHSRNMDTYGIYGHPVQGTRELISAALDDVFAPFE